ncbi:MAG: DEAD/DEAH box helicase family protein [Desulfosporosinus sp.]
MIPKDFQEATANRILQIYKDEHQNRVLLADEVGLGKTIVASAVVRKVSEWHKHDDDHFKVIYICSNINIANQNYRKLGIQAKDCLTISESRLTMQHLKIYQSAGKDHSYQQLIPMTPATSFTMTGGQGMKAERALMYVFLSRYRELAQHKKQLNDLLIFEKGLSWWDWYINDYEKKVTDCDEDTDCYISDMLGALDNALPEHLYDTILDVCVNGRVFNVPYAKRRDIINALRRIFAQISLDKLEPDLIIMDEFQRFKDLIAPRDDESGMLSQRFLSDINTKVLLLSATPYKPYSTLEELSLEEGGHYKEFMQVIDFLLYDKNKNDGFHRVWQGYSGHLSELKTDDLTVLIAKKNSAEDAMYQCICRTERFDGGMIDTSKAKEIEIAPEDIISYTEMQLLLDRLGLGNFPIEYVKSAPYLLSFMNYKIKDKIVRQLAKTNDYTDIKASQTMLLRKNRLNRYEEIGCNNARQKIGCNNARLQTLFDEVFSHGKNGSELMLWIPASKPYYKTDNVFSKNAGYSKLLVFSSWEMVPRMIAGLTSYEAERLTVGRMNNREKANSKRYFAEDDKKRSTAIRLRTDTEELVTYPSITLAKLFDPLVYAGAGITEIRRKLRPLMQEKIDVIANRYQLSTGRGSAKQLLELLKAMDGENCQNTLHVIATDAANLFTNMAIGAPAVCSYRLFKNQDFALQLAKCFVSLFNKQESMSAVDVLYDKGGEFYYEDVIRYCVEGNLQAVLDEYAFVLGSSGEELLDVMTAAFADTASVQIETRESFVNGVAKCRLRTHFAVGYFNSQTSDASIQRTENIRAAFNSPFRPFVLATTSIGQEGLDFHTYSRKIMHWNLPSNPIDLEQREGRINRYLCHAIRQNLANSEYGSFPFHQNVWSEILGRATNGLKGAHSDLIPYWCLPDDFLFTQKIERIVPMYPYSQDRYRYNRMIEILALYRLTLGQPRQEELFEAISKAHWETGEIEELFINLSPYTKEQKLCKA